jgi:hypothetical protein
VSDRNIVLINKLVIRGFLMATLELKAVFGLILVLIILLLAHLMALGSIIRGVIAHTSGCTYFWLRPMRLALDTLFSIFL